MTVSIDHDLREAVSELRRRNVPSPSVALILGSGLGDFAKEISNGITISAEDLPGYPSSTVQGHAGRLIFGSVSDGSRSSPLLLVFQGRVHFYETADVDRTTAPVRLAAALGVTRLLITNAAGGINRSFVPGDLMLMTDVMSLLPPSSRMIAGKQKLLEVFDRDLTMHLKESAREEEVALKEGTYCWLKGPSYETAAEIRMLGILGADAVGMSTVPELQTARALGMRCAGVSLISNMGTGILPSKLSHAEVTDTANRSSERFSRLIKSCLLRL